MRAHYKTVIELDEDESDALLRVLNAFLEFENSEDEVFQDKLEIRFARELIHRVEKDFS